MLDLTSEFVQVEIRDDGRVLWIHTQEEMTVLRICQIKKIEIIDYRVAPEDRPIP